MADTRPAGAVVMAVYRPDPALLQRQIDSLKAQTLGDWRCIVGIDGADDATTDLVTQLVDGDTRFEVVTFTENVGVYRHFERLLRRVPAETTWVSLADQDDYWYPDKFERLVPVLWEDGVTAVLGQARVVDRAGPALGGTARHPGDLVDTVLRNQLTGSFALLRREVLETAFPFPPGTSIAIHDHWLAVCAASQGRIALLDEIVQDYVQHESNVLGEGRPLGVRQLWHVIGRQGGVRRYVDEVASDHWGWSVSMAAAVGERVGPLGYSRALTAISKGRVSPALVGCLARTVMRRQLSVVAAAGMAASAARWTSRVGRAVR